MLIIFSFIWYKIFEVYDENLFNYWLQEQQILWGVGITLWGLGTSLDLSQKQRAYAFLSFHEVKNWQRWAKNSAYMGIWIFTKWKITSHDNYLIIRRFIIPLLLYL